MANLELLVQVQDRELQQLRKDVRTLSKEMGGFSSSTRGATTSYSRLSHESSKANKEISRTTRGVLAGSGAFRGLGRAIAFASGAYLGAAGFTAVVRGAYDELQKQGEVNAQTNSVLKSTGRIAGVTRGEVEQLAKALEHKSGVDNSAIKTSENLLLTFTNVRHVVGQNNNVFARAEKAALDLSVRFHKDLPQATVVLGRALQDPIGGLTTLSRIGVRFSDQQKATIKSLVDSGNVLGAQKLILGEVEKRAKGAADAYGRTLPGQIDKARAAFKDLTAAALKPLVPELARAAEAAAKFFEKPSTQRQLVEGVKEISSVVSQAAGAFSKAKDAVGGWKHLLELLIALKVAKTVYAWSTALAETAVNAGKARSATAGLKLNLANLLKVSAKPIQFVIAYEIIRKLTGSGADLSDPTAPDVTRGKNPYPVGTFNWFQWNAGFTGATAGKNLPAGGAGGHIVAGRGPGAKKPFEQGQRAANAEQSQTGKQRSVVATARKLGPGSGAVYVTGGTSVQTGYDCSGYLYDIYRKNGITIPRTSEAQWNDPKAIQVPKGQEQPGDGVYFTGSSQYAPPGHCGIYVGNDKYIEYFSSGRPARVSRLSQATDYWGARRWIKIKQRGGSSSGGTTNRPTSGTVAAKPTVRALFKSARGLSIRDALAAAQGTKTKADDVRALQDEEAFLREALKSAKKGSEYRTQILEEIGRVQDRIRAKQGKPAAKASDLLPQVIRKNIAVAEGTLKNTKDDIAAWQRALTFLVKLQKTVKPTSEKFIQVQQQIDDARQTLAGLRRKPTSGELVPANLRLGLSRAQSTSGLRDDLSALRRIQTFLTGALKGTKGEKRITILDELNSVKGQIGGIVRDILNKAQTEIAKHRSALGDAFGKVADSLLSAFDDKTSQLVDQVNAQFDQLTPAEQSLLGIQNRERGFERTDLAAAVAKAQQRVGRATGKRSVQAQRDLAQAQDALAQFDLQPIADAERAAREKQRTVALAELDKTRAAERQQLQDQIDEFAKMLAAGGVNMGTAFAKGLLSSFPAFKKAVDAYIAYLTKNGFTATPGSGLAGQAKSPLPIDPAIAAAIRAGKPVRKGASVDAPAGPVQQTVFVPVVIAADLVEAQAKYNRRNGRQTQ